MKLSKKPKKIRIFKILKNTKIIHKSTVCALQYSWVKKSLKNQGWHANEPLGQHHKLSWLESSAHSVWKSPKMSHLRFSILAFFTIFCLIKLTYLVTLFDSKLQVFKNSLKLTSNQYGNTVWPLASGVPKTRQNEPFLAF